jgi:hypothetical protein
MNTSEAMSRALDEVREDLEAHMFAWVEMLEQQQGMLIGERFIVMDKSGRAYSRLPDRRWKLEVPLPGLVGVLQMDVQRANKVAEHLNDIVPDFGPFVAKDVGVYVGERVRAAGDALRVIEGKVHDRLRDLHQKIDRLLSERPPGALALLPNDGHSYFLLSIDGKKVLFTAPAVGESIDPLNFMSANDVPGGGLGAGEFTESCEQIERWLQEPKFGEIDPTLFDALVHEMSGGSSCDDPSGP